MEKPKLYCGKCEEVTPGFADGSVDCIVTDVPFGVSFKSKRTDYDDSEEYVFGMIAMWYAEWVRLLKEDSYAFVFTGVNHIERWIQSGKNAGLTFKNIIATRSFNNSARVARNFAFVLQPVLVFAKGKGRELNNVDFFRTSDDWLNDKRNEAKNPYSYNYPNFIETKDGFGTEVFGANVATRQWHPNAKNAKLCAFFIETATERGERVFDPFMGCGTTGEAALATERTFVGIEQSRKWYDVASKRLANVMPLFQR